MISSYSFLKVILLNVFHAFAASDGSVGAFTVEVFLFSVCAVLVFGKATTKDKLNNTIVIFFILIFLES